MKANRHSSESTSRLVSLLVERSGVGSHDMEPEGVMSALVERLGACRVKNQERRLQLVLKERKINELDTIPGLNCEGMLEPVGTTFAEGFRIRLKRDTPAPRLRFSMAHELCHTFFYELVPEIKFRPHETDDAEEQLCNFGAAVLLIPAKSLRARVKGLPICLSSLEQLAQEYNVSLPTMLIRLKSLGLWNCELTNWHRTVGACFTLDRLYGGPRVEWEWLDFPQLEHVWQSNESTFGTSFVYVADARGSKRFKPVSYNAQRSGTGVMALWGSGIRKPKRAYPLLQRPTHR